MFSHSRSLLFITLALGFGAAAHATYPGDYLQTLHDLVDKGVTQCGLSVVPGNDPGLPSQIQQRRVEEVIGQVLQTGAVDASVLVDQQVIGGNIQLSYSIATTGGLLWSASRDSGSYDLEVDSANHGRLAYTQTFFQNGTSYIYYVVATSQGDQYVTSTDFYNYLNSQVVAPFVASLCPSSKTLVQKGAR